MLHRMLGESPVWALPPVEPSGFPAQEFLQPGWGLVKRSHRTTNAEKLHRLGGNCPEVVGAHNAP
jgi:hypothetical protein